MKRIVRSALGVLLVPAACPFGAHAERTFSRAFELRYFTLDPKANGETDFKGPTEVFGTEERIEYLRRYSKYARRYF